MIKDINKNPFDIKNINEGFSPIYTIDYFVSENIESIIFKKFIQHCINNDISVYHERISIETNIKNLFKNKDLSIFKTKSGVFFGSLKNEKDVYIYGYCRNKLNNIVDLDIFGDLEKVEKTIEYFYKNFNKKSSISVSWYYNPKNSDSVNLYINLSKLPTKEMYPYFDFPSLENYYERFNNSEENILILIGEPGTGKTTFLKGLLSYTKENAAVVYDKNPLRNDDIFIDWFESDIKYFIFEDSDQLLIPREEQNDIMIKFLNMADGLISNNSKKLIFTTNLKNINQIDEALLRPGRCFDILEFKKLTVEQANILAEKYNLPKVNEEKTLAELFSSKNNVFKRKIGFM
ncbi:MAG: ATP-binding protein [Candidatus Dojkabacteria bacterium]|nr:ATP-binding protein [Candidatus Dojkabacteria bacterium]